MDEIMFIEGLLSENDIKHYGTPMHSGRYKWGSGKNPYHHGASNPFGRMKARHEEKKKAAAVAARTEKARQAKADKAEHEKKKAEALRTGSAQDMLPYIKEYTSEELQTAKKRIQLEAEFRDMAVKERSEIDPAVQVRMAKIEKATKYAETGVGAYNVAARVYNAFSGKHELPVIATGGSNSRKNIKDTKKRSKLNFRKEEADARSKEASAREAEIKAEQAKYDFDHKKKKAKKANKTSTEITEK